MKALGLEDGKKIGMLMMFVAIITYILGLILIFNRVLVLTANMFFLAGMYFFIGFGGSLWFFQKKGKRRGSALYFLGLLLIILHLTFIGTCVQLCGLFIIFRSFLPDIYDAFTRIPYIGKYLKSYKVQNYLDSVSTSNKVSRI